ncbi:hypothetical protein GCM10023231_16260 [Olivibacter ginsenosidimutans]|uniref:DUF3822 family protein n=1 Tax=Olivibacter ginsenosidimutans TaxID=1176537 RepID=A0ABP9B435_9SPHI
MSELLQIAFIDDNFSVDNSNNYQLLISEERLRHQMAIVTADNQLLLLLSWKKGANEARVNQLLGLTYQSKKIAIDNKNIILIPSDLYDSSQESHYFNMLALDQDDHILLTDSLADLAIYNVYPLAKKDSTTINQNFPEFHFLSRNTSILSALQKLEPSSTYLSVNSSDAGFTDFTYITEGKLRYHQTQPSEHADEFNYFLLAIAEELAFDFSNTPIFVSGTAQEGHPYYDRLTKYSKHVQTLALSNLITCSHDDVHQRMHQQLPLFGLLCVS